MWLKSGACDTKGEVVEEYYKTGFVGHVIFGANY
jgi:hypothetical protein